MRSGLAWSGVLAALLLVPGCTGDVVGGGSKDVEMYAVADGGPGGESAIAAGSAGNPLGLDRDGARGQGAVTLALAAPTGTIEFDVTATLVDEQGVNIVLTPDARVALRLEAADSTRFATRRAPQAEYPILRLNFSRISATVETGLIVGGVPFPGPLRVDIPAGGLIVDVPVDLNVPARAREVLVVDLNASEWMPMLNVQTRVVPSSAFRSAVRVRVR